MARRSADSFLFEIIDSGREQAQGTSMDSTRVHRKRTRFEHHGIRPPRHTSNGSAGRDRSVLGQVIKHND